LLEEMLVSEEIEVLCLSLIFMFFPRF